MGTINADEKKPDSVSFVLVYVSNQPRWMTENTLYIKSRLDLLPEYADKKAVLVSQHKEPTHEELMERIAAQLTQSIKFGRYGIEDGPEVECFDEDDNIVSLIVPGDSMDPVLELPKLARVDTPSVKYAPAEHEPIAVFVGHGATPKITGFKFLAWFRIEHVELFAANSADLAAEMQNKKWAADIDREWCVFQVSPFYLYLSLSFLLSFCVSLWPSGSPRAAHG